MSKAARLLFGDATKKWPDGFCLVRIKFLSPELEQCLNECGVLVSRGATADDRESESLVLITPESDKERLTQALLQMQVNEGTDQPELAANDSDQEDDNEEFRQFPLGKSSTALMFAAALGDTTLLKTLLDHGTDPNKRDPGGDTALMIAARNGHLNAVRILMHDSRTQVNLKNCKDKSALLYAAAQGHVEVFSILLVFGNATLNRERPFYGHTDPFLVAASNGHYGICKRIIETGMDVDFQDIEDHYTALQYAATNGHIECCRLLIDAGANVNHVNDNGNSILHTVIRCGHIQVFELLIARGAALTYGEDSSPLLTEAVLYCRFEFIKRLIELKVDVNLVHQGVTALDTITRPVFGDANKDIAKILLEAGANPDIADKSGFNTLVYAARNGDVPLMSLLIKHGAKVRSKHHFGYLALCEATKYGQLDAIKFLLASGAPTSVPRWQLSDAPKPLLVLAMCCNDFSGLHDLENALDLLLNNGASWREVDASGHDALMHAVAAGYPKLVARLLKAGATVGQANVNGLNALEMAIEFADRALGTVLPPRWENNLSINLLLTVLQGVKRQADGGSLISAALQKAQHSVTRELLLQKLQGTPDFSISFSPSNWRILQVRPNLRSACINSTKDWDRTEFEIQLAANGTPVPAIDFYCDYVEAFPAMKVKLFGPVNAEEINQGYWTEFFLGINATMEKMLVVENEIDHAYEGIAWEFTRKVVGQSAQKKIDYAVTYSTTAEQQRHAGFAELFDNCLKSTLSTQSSQGLQLHALPAPGLIAADLMGQWVYAALAEHIENAWRAAWLATIKPAQEATEVVFTADEYAAIGATSFRDMVMQMSTHTISEQQSSQLLHAFKNALRSSYRDLLKLPNASLKEAALYADLMERQLHMLMQFVNDTAEVETPALMPDSM